MALKDSLETHIIGPILEIKHWMLFDWVHVIAKLTILVFYIFAQSIISLKVRVLKFIINTPICRMMLEVNVSIWTCIPVFGKYGKRLLPQMIAYISNKVIPTLEKVCQLLELSFQLHIVEMTLKDKKNVQIFVTAESDDLEIFDEEQKLSTTLLLANHRSINDYTLINYFIQNCNKNRSSYEKKRHLLKKFWQENKLPIPRLNFITWGKVVNFPHLSLLKNILIKDENVFVYPSKIKEHINNTGNQVLTIFPEVNILTTELTIVQRKLNQDYPFVAKFYNVLYPRFRNFISTIKCFAHINHVKRKQQHNIFNNAKIFFNNGVDKLITKATPHSKYTTQEETAQAAMILGLPNSDDHIEMTILSDSSDEEVKVRNEDQKNSEEKKGRVANPTIKVNQCLYDLTIIYYKPKYTNVGHDHVNGQFKLHDGYQLEQVNPSLFEMLQPERKRNDEDETYKCTKPPIVIMIHIRKHELGVLLPAKGRNLEKWLENQWLEKDKLIDSIENGIRIK